VGFENTTAARQTAIIRHDVDFDPAQAARMAALESALGIRSTYFFLLRTEMYNVLSEAGTAALRSILAYGHEIGLHFDARAYDSLSASALREAVHSEMNILRNWFGLELRYLSFHRPAPALLSDSNGAITAPYIHAYQTCYSKDRAYFSDSQGSWRYGHPLEADAFKEGRALQILIHPIWWDGNANPFETLERFVESHADKIGLETAKNCVAYRRGKYANVGG